VLLLHQIPDLEAFGESAGVVGEGYAAILAAKIYRLLFRYSIDLKRDFEAYYQPEYNSFSEYLHCNFDLPETFLKRADELSGEYEHIRLAEPYVAFLQGEDGERRLRALLGEELL
jgi:hypothetical protein